MSQISRIHSAAFRDGPILRINSSKHCIKELNPAHEYCLPTFTYISVRHKGKKGRWAVGPTKNPSGRPPGKSRGLKVYDGQRVPTGTVLVNQMRPVIFPGWNVRFGWTNRLHATVDGRVIITTELADLDWDEYKVEKHVARGSQHLKKEKIYRNYIHVIPDIQHQYFKLVERI